MSCLPLPVHKLVLRVRQKSIRGRLDVMWRWASARVRTVKISGRDGHEAAVGGGDDPEGREAHGIEARLDRLEIERKIAFTDAAQTEMNK
jgi:hypothetical protein